MPTVATSSAQTKTPSTDAHPTQEEAPAATGQTDTTLSATPVAPMAAGEIEKLHGDVARLTTTVEQLQRRLGADAPKDSVPPLQTSPADGDSRVMTSTAILLAAIGLCVGWLLGNAYGRRQERGRRPRVRL
jgi:hypothetical protein